MIRTIKTTITLVLIMQPMFLSGCISVKDSDGNTVYIDGSGSKVTSPEGRRIYEYNSYTGRSTKHDEMGGSEESVYNKGVQQ